MRHDILRASAYTELGSPDAHTRTDVITGIASPPRTIGALIKGLRYPGDRPQLAMMGVSAELEIHARALRFLQMVGLVV